MAARFLLPHLEARIPRFSRSRTDARYRVQARNLRKVTPNTYPISARYGGATIAIQGAVTCDRRLLATG
jgi:hypothetical protein